MFRLYCFLIGYIFGCFQTAYVLGKIFKKPDIRKYGSGNLGGTSNISGSASKHYGTPMTVSGVDYNVFGKAANEIKSARPTAVNLFWAVDRVLNSQNPLYRLQTNAVLLFLNH